MNYATIKWTDIANGEGVRISLFVSGCTHRCKNCFNEIAWDFNYGEKFDDEIQEKIEDSTKDLIYSKFKKLCFFEKCYYNAKQDGLAF